MEGSYALAVQTNVLSEGLHPDKAARGVHEQLLEKKPVRRCVFLRIVVREALVSGIEEDEKPLAL